MTLASRLSAHPNTEESRAHVPPPSRRRLGQEPVHVSEVPQLLEREVELGAPCEKWIVWPAVQGGEPREDELAAEGIRVVGYEEGDDGFVFTVGRAP